VTRSFERWSPAIFWCLASGSFCLLLELGHPLVELGIAIALSIAAGTFRLVSIPLSLAGGALAGYVLYRVHPALGGIGLIWAASSLFVARARAALALNRRLAADLASCFGAGYTPKGSGTVGAVTAVPIGWLLSQVEREIGIGILVVAAIAGIGASYWYMAGRTDDLDPKEVVLDEHVGVLIAFAAVPWEWPWVAAAFALFRLFDIWKPWPVGWLDKKVKNPAGVMLDDYAAGLMAAAVLIGARLVNN
jgi:phosphatidylglycerophosphatase A